MNGKYIRSQCKDCRKKYDKGQYTKNSEKIKERKKEYRKEARDNIRKLNKEWKQKNKSRFTAYAANRRARLLNATPSWADKEQIVGTYKLARYLSEKYGKEIHVDHIVPLNNNKVCGLHVEDNLQLLYAEDNIAKSNTFYV